jgi:pilus assembly protein CpaE
MKGQNNVLIVSHDAECSDWLSDALEQFGVRHLRAQPPTLDKVMQIASLAAVDVVFVYVSRYQESDTTLIEGLVAAKPLLPVIAVSEAPDQHMLLMAMRAGARDFLSMDASPNDILAMLNRVRPRDPLPQQAEKTGEVFAVLDARPGYGATLLAIHLALELQTRGDTLLIDLGVPHGDAGLILGLESTYTFVDALRSIRRLDSKLIETGFPRHTSGLTLLTLPEETWGLDDISSADAFLLLCALRRHFGRIVVNLCGLPRSDLLLLLLNNADSVVMLAEQNLLSCRSNAKLLEYLRENRIDLERIGLAVDRYSNKIPISETDMSKTLGVRFLGAIPSSGMSRINCLNSKSPIGQRGTDDTYNLAVRRIADKLGAKPAKPGAERAGNSLGGFFARLLPRT